MKYLAFIFSCYLLTLSCIPCLCDDMQVKSTADHQITKSSSTKSTGKEDNCNPFCSCTSCPSSAFFFQRNIQIAEPIVFFTAQKFSSLDQPFTSYTFHNIWQPPKLG